VVSRLQSRKDRIGADDGENELSFDQFEDLTGSIFLSCLALLYSSCSQNSNSHERIFTAQALNHRCRSIKLTETLDIEAEDGVECGTSRLVIALEELKNQRNNTQPNTDLNQKTKSILTAWLERYVPMLVNRCGGGAACTGAELLAVVLERHSSSLLDSPYLCDESRGEEQIKGTLMMFSLAVAMYVAAFRDFEDEHQHQNQHDEAGRSPWANAVLSELGSALSVTVLRLRYRPTTDKHDTPSPDPSCPPLIDALVHAINMVKDSAAVYLTNQAGSEMPSLLQDAHHYAVNRSIAACLTSLPETVLLPPGQDYMHRIPSVDRGCLRAASMELRCNETGMEKAMSVLLQLWGNVVHDDSSASRLIQCCEAWARYVAVPIHVIDESVGKIAMQFIHISQGAPSSMQQQKAQTLAFQYLVSIFEAALPTLSVPDILTAALGVGATGVQNGKRKQGNKSKKRHEKRLDRAKAVEDESSQNQAEEELLARKNAACAAAAAAFGISAAAASHTGDDWGLRLASTCPKTTSHAICSTVAAAATSVLPHLLWLERNDGPSQRWRTELFSVVITVIQRMCKSHNRDTRALAYEALMVLHNALNTVTAVSLRVEQIAIDSICECALSLSASCAYPLHYFDNLSENNDEDLEIERNDVRDVCRSVCSLDSGNYGSDESKSPSIMILNRIVHACHSAITDTDLTVLPSEAVVHALSALAKPLNFLGEKCAKQLDEEGCTILLKALDAFGDVFQRLNSLIEQLPHSKTLPLSRLALIGFASLAPLLNSVAQMALRSTTATERHLIDIFEKTLCAGIKHSILSTTQIPELVAESTLESTRYDIKGAMRGPGGEDHVGCIALIRMSGESDELRNSIFKVCGESILQDLTSLHHALKRIEVERGVGVEYGKGVTPLSRRLLIRVVSRLGMMQGGTVLHSLLEEPLSEIITQKSAPFSIEKLFRLCEAALDLSFFSPELLSHLFRNRASDLDSLFETLIMGYTGLSVRGEEDSTTYQWGRLRCGVICLLRACQSMTDYSSGVLTALIKAECETAVAQCGQGPQSGSNLFKESIVGEAMIHSGAYVMLIGEYLKHVSSGKNMTMEDQVELCRRCVHVLKHSAPDIASILLHESPEATNHVDPRLTLAEAWFLTMKALASVCRNNEQINSSLVADNVQILFSESLSLAMLFIFMKDIGGKKRPAPDVQRGMSPDGPQTLAISDFIFESMLLGPSILSGSFSAFSAHIQLNCGNEVPSEVLGAAVISASLLRAISGATPPWVVEDTPILFNSIYTSLGSNLDLFIQTLGVSTKLETLTDAGALRAGEKLCGRYLDASDSHINSFLSKASECAAKNDWKKMKVVLKSATGGKKKESGFNLKPHYSSWEGERV
jgi:hypothetical protein